MSKNMLSKKSKLEKLKLDASHLNPFNFEEFEGNYLLTNDFGNYIFLTPANFKRLLENNFNEHSELYNELWRKGFIKRDLSEYESLHEQYRSQKASLFTGSSLHIVVVTLRCNQNCVYCQASSKGMDNKGVDMDMGTAKKTVDRIFETTSDFITIEFQGGEPLVNWDVVKFIVEYAREKEQKTGKEVHFSLVSNLSLLTEERLDFLAEKLVGICTSLDGPEEIHNRNRPYPHGNGYQETIKWIKKYREKREEMRKKGKELTRINALVTLSKISLDYSEEIINEYLRLGFFGIHLRPLSYLGYSSGNFRDKMGYPVEDFLDFWRKSLDYIIEINNLGHFFIERETQFRLVKILAGEDPGYTDLASPCGAGIGQMLYDYDGNVYTCDEGRMVEDDIFKIGEVKKDSYEDMIKSDTSQAMITCSLLENQPCRNCVYKPYCGICPVKNYNDYGTLWPQIKNTGWCKMQKEQFGYIFSKIKDEKYRKVFEDWVK